MAEGSSEGRLEVKTIDFQFVPREHAGLNGGDVDRPEVGWFLHSPIPYFACVNTLRGRTSATGYNAPTVAFSE